MVAPFLRTVESLEDTKENGTDVKFFEGPGYAALPINYVGAIRKFSLKYLAVEDISKAESKEADTLNPFVLCLRDDEARDLFYQFANLLESEISGCVRSSTEAIIEAEAERMARFTRGQRTASVDASSAPAETADSSTLLDRHLDEHFDALRSACDLRDFLLHLNSFVKRQSNSGNKGAALIIEA